MDVLCLFPYSARSYDALEDPRNQGSVNIRPADVMLALADGKNGTAHQFLDRSRCIDIKVPSEAITTQSKWKFLISNFETSAANIYLPRTENSPNFTVSFYYGKPLPNHSQQTQSSRPPVDFERAALMMRVRSDSPAFFVRVIETVTVDKKQYETERYVTSQDVHLRDVLFLDIGAFVFQVGHARRGDHETPAILHWKQLRIAEDRAPISVLRDQWRPLDRTLGKGSSGTVEVILGMLSGALRASKTVRIELHESSKASQTRAEDHVLAILMEEPHDHIVRHYGTLREQQGPDQLYIFYFQACHGDIEQLIRQGIAIVHFPTIVKHIGSAIRHLHNGKGIIHRDVKPQNLFFLIPTLDEAGFEGNDRELALSDHRPDSLHFFLGDFGHARGRNGRDFKTYLGTPQYLPPEINGYISEPYGTSADIFSFGVSLLEILNGYSLRKLYDEHVHGRSVNYHLYENRKYLNAYVRALQDLPAPGYVHSSIWNFLLKMVSFSPIMRPTINEVTSTLSDVVVYSAQQGQPVTICVDGQWQGSRYVRVAPRSEMNRFV